MIAQVLGLLPPTWEAQMVFLASTFEVASLVIVASYRMTAPGLLGDAAEDGRFLSFAVTFPFK